MNMQMAILLWTLYYSVPKFAIECISCLHLTVVLSVPVCVLYVCVRASPVAVLCAVPVCVLYSQYGYIYNIFRVAATKNQFVNVFSGICNFDISHCAQMASLLLPCCCCCCCTCTGNCQVTPLAALSACN